MKLSEALRRFRKTYKITQKQAAQIAGVTERGYQKYEAENSVPAATVLLALADYFGCSLDYLTGRTDNPEVNR